MIVYSERYLEHNQEFHPENSQRLKVVMNYLTKKDVFERVPLLEPVKAGKDDVLRVHTKDYYLDVEEASLRGNEMLDVDTYVNPATFDVALLAAGGVLTCVDKAFEGYETSFALIRPPGHHATSERAMGFCIFNNVAIGAAYAIKKHGVERVAILDYDVHHGNGTQDIFYQDNRVLYISLHQSHLYPGTGSAEEFGEGRGAGYTINMPLPPMVGDRSYLKVISEIAFPVIKQFDPEMIFVSAGYDSHHSDPLGGMNLTTACYREISGSLWDMRKKVIFALEGGYNTSVLAKAIYASISAFFDLPFEAEETMDENRGIASYVDSKITTAKNMLSNYWSF
ncbi:MAG: histone deacetylase [Candidatus Hydrothermarchaeaceae archaeon]